MIKSLNATAVVALLLAGTAAHAEGEYYKGIQKETKNLDGLSTGAIVEMRVSVPVPTARPNVNSGDYYGGASRPN